MDKRKIIIGIIVTAVTVSIYLYVFTPKAVICYPQNKNTQIHRVIYEGEDVTNQIDQIALIHYLAEIKCKRTFNRFSPMLSSDITVEIDFVDNGNVLHLILGNANIRYESANKNGYTILNSDEVLDKIEGMIVE